ncbi:MAG: MFS transporter [Lachnospiraceae bacterium]|nr:MFS transporter [Lachnospiraceae bacterium]
MKKQKEKSQFPFSKKVIWNFSSISNGFLSILLGYLNYYLTQNVLLSAASVGIVLMASKIFDGFTDLIAGYIIERTSSKFGKGRPWSLCIAMLWPIVILLFSVPSFFSTTGKLAYVFVCYLVIQSVFQTLYSCSDTVYMLRAVKGEKDRANTLAIGGVIITYSCTILSILMPAMIKMWGSTSSGWTLIAVLLAIPSIALPLIKFFVIREQPLVDENGKQIKEDKPSIKQMVNHVFHNKYALILFGMWLVFQFGQNLSIFAQTYFFTYNIGNLAIMSLVSMTALVTPLITLAIPPFQAKYGKTNVIRVGIAINLVGSIIRAIFPTNIPVLIGTAVLLAVGMLPLTYFFGLFLMDAMDYGEWKLGYRVESSYTALQSVGQKVAAGLASGFGGIFMGMTGFVSGSKTQTAGATNGIYILFIIVPIAVDVLVLLFLRAYDLDGKIDSIKKELLVKRSEKEAAAAKTE